MWLTNSSLGRKLVMAVTGVCLILFVTFHCLMNGVAIFWPEAYNGVCEFLGANWYALIASIGLAVLFIIHIFYAVWLTIQNRRARGNDRYAVTSKPKQVEWASQNMLILGIVILAFLILHLVQFWAKMQLAEITGVHEHNPANGVYFINVAFGCWITPVAYIIGFIALWFHMTHGFWSMFQSAGWDNDTWLPRLKTIGNWWTTLVVLLFIAQAAVFTIRANNACNCNCAITQQWEQLAADNQECTIQCDDCQAACEGECNGCCTQQCDGCEHSGNCCAGCGENCAENCCAGCADCPCDKENCTCTADNNCGHCQGNCHAAQAESTTAGTEN